jgi:hypothetical protein
MAFAVRAVARAATGIIALLGIAALAGCEGALGTSPPHAAPADIVAEGEDGQVELSWDAVTDATRYVILWDTGQGAAPLANEITGIEDTHFTHTGLENLTRYRYRIVAETSGGRGPESNTIFATPGPVPDAVEWVAVTNQNPGHTIHFDEVAGATLYRVYLAPLESQLAGRRPQAAFEEAEGSPHVRSAVAVTSGVFYRVIPMNDTRVGTGSPVAIPPANVISEHDLPIAGAAFGRVTDDDCLDLITATGGVETAGCLGTLVARDLAAVGLGNLIAAPRVFGDGRFVDVNGDGFDDLFSNTASPADESGSVALLHLNQGNGNFQASAAVTDLGIGGFGGTVLAADFDNDGDVDLFAPNDQTRGDGARNWFLVNDGAGGFTDRAATAGLETNPPGAAFVPQGGQAVDFDEDGFVDLLFGSRLLLNDGDGTFSDATGAANVPELADQGLKLADIDLDGDLDLVHSSGTDTRLFRNEGGVFDAGQRFGVQARPSTGSGLTVCDINGDGFEDVVAARNRVATGVGSPKILVNVDGSLLISSTQEGTPADPNGLLGANAQLACGDQNNDGLPDVLARWGKTYRVMRGSSALTRRIRLRIVDAAGDRNQQGRVVRVVPNDQPDRIMTRVVESGSGLRAQGMYDVLVGAPWPGDYEVTVRFADGDVTTTLEAGDEKIVFADGRVEDIDPEEE